MARSATGCSICMPARSRKRRRQVTEFPAWFVGPRGERVLFWQAWRVPVGWEPQEIAHDTLPTRTVDCMAETRELLVTREIRNDAGVATTSTARLSLQNWLERHGHKGRKFRHGVHKRSVRRKGA